MIIDDNWWLRQELMCLITEYLLYQTSSGGCWSCVPADGPGVQDLKEYPSSVVLQAFQLCSSSKASQSAGMFNSVFHLRSWMVHYQFLLILIFKDDRTTDINPRLSAPASSSVCKFSWYYPHKISCLVIRKKRMIIHIYRQFMNVREFSNTSYICCVWGWKVYLIFKIKYLFMIVRYF